MEKSRSSSRMKHQMYDNPILAIPSESEGWFFLVKKRNMTLNDFISSVSAPLSGELPKAGGEQANDIARSEATQGYSETPFRAKRRWAAQAVYFTMNISSVLSAIRS